jgi:glycosyltransferase involved in cell wall biosynthesis
MKILFLSQYFPPEMGAPAARVSELSKCWAQAGERVTVVTTFPNHPNGVIPPEYRGMKFLKEETGGYTVLRSWIYIAANKGFFKRLVCFLSFMASSAFVGIFRAGKCDAVIATSPQIFVGLSGWLVSVFKRRPFVLEVRDLWPDSAIQLKILRNPFLIWLSRRLEHFLYRRAHLIVPVSESIRDEIRAHGIAPERIELVPNGIDPDLFSPGERDNEKRERLGIGRGDFLVSYIGTHGMSHGLDNVVEAAALLKGRKDIHFVFIGDGARKEKLIALSQERAVENLHFLPPQPKQEIPAWLAASDVCLVSLLNLPVFNTVLPSKMFEIMACERPALMVGGGECVKLVENAEAGIAVPPASPQELADAIVRLAQEPERLREYGANGRRYVLEHFNRGKLAQRYLDRLRTDFSPDPSAPCP